MTTGLEELTQIRDSDTGEWCYIFKPRLNIGDVVKVDNASYDGFIIDTVRGYEIDLAPHLRSFKYKGKTTKFEFSQVRATLTVKETFNDEDSEQ